VTQPIDLAYRAQARPARVRGGRTWRAVALVLAFWWAATGLLIALQRSAGSRVGALVLTLVAAPLGLWLVVRARRAWTERAAVASFFGGALLWTAVSAAFYGGWVVGPTIGAPRAGDALARATDAIVATSYSTVFAAALLLTAVLATRRAPNRLGILTFATFWAAHELAKLNVFAGVLSPGVHFLPDYLGHLQRYFGPARNSALLPASVALLTGSGVALLVRARRDGDPGRRLGAVLLAALLLLAALEHALLGSPRDPGWWNAFLAWRELR